MKKMFLMAGLVLASSLYSQNLYQGDTSAEAETDTMTDGTYTSVVSTWHWDDSTAYDGKRSIRLDWMGKMNYPGRHAIVPYLSRLSMKGPELEAEKTYTFSFYAKASQSNYPLTLILRPGAGHIYEVEGSVITKQFKLSTEWRRYQATFSPKFKVDVPKKGYTPIFQFHEAPSGSIWVDAIQMELGREATPYRTPNPVNVGVTVNCGNLFNIFSEGEKIEAVLRTAAASDIVGEVNWRIVDFQGKIVHEQKRRLNGNEEISITADNKLFGWYKIIVEANVAGRMVSSNSKTFVNLKSPVELAPHMQPYCGVFSFPGYDVFELLCKLGVKRQEVRGEWGFPVLWVQPIEYEPGKYDWEVFEWTLKRGRKFGMYNKVASAPMYAPKWLFDPAEWENANAMNSRLVLTPDKFSHWTGFLGEMMTRCGSMIDEIEIGGEDNGRLGRNEYYRKLYPHEIQTATDGTSWLCGGKPFDDLCAMVRAGAREIHRHYPNMKVGAIRPWGGFPGDNWPFVRAMFKQIGKDFNVFPVDQYIMPYHYGPKIDPRRRLHSVDDRQAAYGNAKSLTREYGIGQEVYMSESGFAVDVNFIDEDPLRQFQAEQLAKDFIACRVAGYTAYDYFHAFTVYPSSSYSFTFHQNRRIQSLAAAYSAVARIVENITEGRYLTPDRTTRIVPMRKHDGSGIAAIWAEPGYTLNIPQTALSELTMHDMMGNQLSLTDTQIPLENAPRYFFHADYKRLCALIDKFDIDEADFCQILFRMVSPNQGQLKFVNNSNIRDYELEIRISQSGKALERVVDLPRGSDNICEFPLTDDKLAVHVQRVGSRKGVMQREFTLPLLTPVKSGKEPASVAQVRQRTDIYPPADPWVTWTGPEDLSADFRISWDSENLYLLVLVTDDLHFNKFKERTYEGDSIQIAIDPKNTGNFYLPAGGKALGPDHVEFGLALGNDGQTYRHCSYGPRDLCSRENSSVTRDDKQKLTTYRLTLPWKKLGVRPWKGMLFGMSLVIFDDDADAGQNYYAPIGAGIAGSKKPALYKKFILE